MRMHPSRCSSDCVVAVTSFMSSSSSSSLFLLSILLRILCWSSSSLGNKSNLIDDVEEKPYSRTDDLTRVI